MAKPVHDWDKWYNAQVFGNPTTYGYHEGIDLNLKTGGDTDLNQPLLAVSRGRVVYYHNNSHPGYGFGRHLVYKVETWFGDRWVHYAHCTDKDFTGKVTDVAEGTLIARLGKSGTQYAHLHMSVLKKDPGLHPRGIDAIAKTRADLDEWWEDPLVFLNKLEQEPPEVTMPEELKDVEGLGKVTFDKLVYEYGEERKRRMSKDAEIAGLEAVKKDLSDRNKVLESGLATQKTECQSKITELEAQIKSLVDNQTQSYDVGQALQVLVQAIKRAWSL